MSIEMRRLKFGTEAPASEIEEIMNSLNDMMSEQVTMLAVVDLTDHIETGKEVTGSFRDLLVERGLMKEDGSVSNTVKEVVLSVVQGEGLTFNIGSPYED
jgi:hypothetical protein